MPEIPSSFVELHVYMMYLYGAWLWHMPDTAKCKTLSSFFKFNGQYKMDLFYFAHQNE
jgi:hypothetical protein